MAVVRIGADREYSTSSLPLSLSSGSSCASRVTNSPPTMPSSCSRLRDATQSSCAAQARRRWVRCAARSTYSRCAACESRVEPGERLPRRCAARRSSACSASRSAGSSAGSQRCLRAHGFHGRQPRFEPLLARRISVEMFDVAMQAGTASRHAICASSSAAAGAHRAASGSNNPRSTDCARASVARAPSSSASSSCVTRQILPQAGRLRHARVVR